MPLFWKKQAKVEKMLEQYFEQTDNCFHMFEKAFNTFIQIGLGATFNAELNNVQDFESAADDLRREIEFTLYGRALLPESRGDILGLLENFDKIPGIAETTLYALSCQKMIIPENLKEHFLQLVKVNLEAYYLTRKAVDYLMTNPRVTLNTTKAVEKKESESDSVEREIICKVFESEMDSGERILFRDLAILIGSISDLCETMADRISIIAIKRQI